VVSTLFKDENDFRNFISGKLKEKGYESIGQDYRINRKKVDLLMRKNKIVAIEVKYLDPRAIADDIAKLSSLRYTPDVDLFFVAAPKVTLQEDILGYAKKMGIGVFGVTDKDIEILINAEEVSPASLFTSAVTIPNIVAPGEIFEWTITIENKGGKMARNIKATYISASPFRVPRNDRNRKLIKKLMPGAKQTVSFKVKIENGAKTENYSIYGRMTAEGLRPIEHLYNIHVQEKLT
jgi:hypothetical protein